MERRLLVVLTVASVAVVAVSLSAAATMSLGDSKQPARAVEPEKDTVGVKPAKNAVSRVSKRTASAPVIVSSGRPQSSRDVRQYWTKERMEDAQPMAKTRPGARTTEAPSLSPPGVEMPGEAPNTTAQARKPRVKQSAKLAPTAGATGVVTSPAVSDPNYWTDDLMDDAQPLDNTRPGGAKSQDESDTGGTTVPGSPPP